MNYERGLETLKRLSKDASWLQDVVLQEGRLRENLDKMRRFGDNPTRQSDRTEIVDALNALALTHIRISFIDLCLGQEPSQLDQPSATALPVAKTAEQAPSLDERRHQEELLDAYQERLRVLELQQAQFGYAVPAHIVTEIKGLQKQIEDIKRQIGPA